MKTRSSYTSDYIIAIVVVLCTVALLAGLNAALTGYHWQKAGRILHVDFPDVAGIHRNSSVRYAGAPAGAVMRLRHLTPEERLANSNPQNAVRVTIRLRDDVPPIPDDVIAVLGADTLLSEKFIGLNAGTAGNPLLADGSIIQGLPQPTFDDLIRNADHFVNVMSDLAPKVKQQVTDLLPKIASIAETGSSVAQDIQPLLTKASTLMDQLTALSGTGQDVAGDAKALLGRVNQLVVGNEANIEKTLNELPEVLNQLDGLVSQTQGLIGENENDLGATLRDLRLVMQDMRVVAAQAKSVTATLYGGRPTRLIWTKDNDPTPSEVENLRGRPDAQPARPARSTSTSTR